MTEDIPPALVSTSWLIAHQGASDVRLLDGSFHLPGSGRNARAEYEATHLPQAQFFDIDGICDTTSPLPHMRPTPAAFAHAMGALGLRETDRVIVYDMPGSPAAARIWWTFRSFGHRAVAILDGGLAGWQAAGQPVTNVIPKPEPTPYRAQDGSALVRSLAQVLDIQASGQAQIIDNRSEERFLGTAPEPRPAAHLGHIPGSINIPFQSYFEPDDTTRWRSPDDLATVFKTHGVDLTRPMIASCGSGVTAATTAFAAYLLGKDDVAIYDGAWAEWGNRDDTPVAR